jgi:preprotein translocase subunit SecF
MFIARHYKLFISISLIVVVLVIGATIWHRPSLGIDFTGGSVLEVSYDTSVDQPTQDMIQSVAQNIAPKSTIAVRALGNGGWSVATPFLTAEEHTKLLSDLSFADKYKPTEELFSSVGPSVGQELKQKALWAIGLVALAIILFVAFAFRKVSKPVSSWLYGVSAIIALLHDVAVPTGVFAIISVYTTAEVNVLFVTALLAIFGFSVNDTIVVFDRIRENLRKNQESHTREDFVETVGHSLSQTYGRSLNTSLTTALALAALFFFGGPATHYFALTLLIGIIAGTYSSIFLASPLLILFSKIFHGKEI